MRKSALVALSVLLGGSDAWAQQRFQLERTETGFIRLDTQTGALTRCREEAAGLSCVMAPDERAAYEQELDLLEKRVAALEARLGTGTGTGTGKSGALPGEDEVDRALSIMERFIRRFMAIVRDLTPSGRDEAQPDRT